VSLSAGQAVTTASYASAGVQVTVSGGPVTTTGNVFLGGGVALQGGATLTSPESITLFDDLRVTNGTLHAENTLRVYTGTTITPVVTTAPPPGTTTQLTLTVATFGTYYGATPQGMDQRVDWVKHKGLTSVSQRAPPWPLTLV
jgi:hypothetical protein